MKQGIFRIIENAPVASSVFRMRLEGDTSAVTRSGQFVNIMLDGCYLRRPISVHDRDGSGLTLIYKVVGSGTLKMSGMKPGDTLDLLTGLGNGFDTSACRKSALLVGGGVGVAPLRMLAAELLSSGKAVTAILGFNTSDEVFGVEELSSLGAEVIVCTADGTGGIRGFVTDALSSISAEPDYFYACGPTPMSRALCAATDLPGELSLEERMGCGVGICYGCTCKTASGPKRVCKEGPVFKKEEIIWQ